MNDQGQHRVSQTYLKQFGFRDKNNHWKISVYEQGNPITHHKSVKSFTKETNLFDLDYFEGKTKRLFEDNCQKLETHYPNLLKSISKNGQLLDEYKELLVHYIPSLMCRNIPFRTWIQSLIAHSETRNKFFKEITMFEDDPEHYQILKSLNPDIDIKFQVNLVMFNTMRFLLRILKSFNFVVFIDYEQRGWITSDNPVVFNRKDNYNWTIPLESEIIFPLSPNYCLFVYHPNFQSKTGLNRFNDSTVNELNEDQFALLTKYISHNIIKYLIFATDLGSVDLRES